MLKNILLISFAVAFLYGCGGSSGGDSSSDTSSIVGHWSYIYPASSCEESYSFNVNGTWSESSLDEVQSGTYTFDETVNAGERHALSIVITSDNGLSDCNGVSSNDTGVTGTVYAVFTNNDTTMEWYETLTGGSTSIVLNKN
jgi:hypothetical protein